MSAGVYVPEVFETKWLPAGLTFKTWDEIEPWYKSLIERALGSVADLEAWLSDVDELNSAVAQEGNKRYVAMTCQTDDEAREQDHLEYIRDIEPRLKPWQNATREKYLDSPSEVVYRETDTGSSTVPWRTVASYTARPTSPARPRRPSWKWPTRSAPAR